MDVRLYYFSDGILKKWGVRGGMHKWDSIESCNDFVEARLKTIDESPNLHRPQFVIVIYTGNYEASIYKVFIRDPIINI